MSENNRAVLVHDLRRKSPERRTKSLADGLHPDLFHISNSTLFLITHNNYSGGLDLSENEYAYMKLISEDAKVEIQDEVLCIDGEIAAKVSFKNSHTNEGVISIDKPLVTALFSVVLMKLRKELDGVCPPGYSNDLNFRSKQPQDIREVDDATLFEWYHKDLFNYTVKVYFPEFLYYMGYEHPSNEQIAAVKQRIWNLSRVMGIMEYESRRFHCRREFLLMDPGFEDETNVLYIHSPYMNKLVERIIRDKIPRMITTKNGTVKPSLDTKGRQVYYPELATIIRPKIISAKNKRSVEIVYEIGNLLSIAGREVTPNINVGTLIGRCYELSAVLVEAFEENPRDHKKRNQILRRAFETAWKYLHLYSDIPNRYEYEEFIPKDTDYEHKLEFFHRKAAQEQ